MPLIFQRRIFNGQSIQTSSSITALPAGGDVSAVVTKVNTIENRVDVISTQVDQVSADIAAADSRLATVEDAVTELEAPTVTFKTNAW